VFASCTGCLRPALPPACGRAALRAISANFDVPGLHLRSSKKEKKPPHEPLMSSPVSGRRSTRFVSSAYVFRAAVASSRRRPLLLASTVWSPALLFLTLPSRFRVGSSRGRWRVCVFNAQDSVLIGVRRAVVRPGGEPGPTRWPNRAAFRSRRYRPPLRDLLRRDCAALAVSLVPVNHPHHSGGFFHGMHRRGRASCGLPARTPAREVSSRRLRRALFWLPRHPAHAVIVLALECATANAYFRVGHG